MIAFLQYEGRTLVLELSPLPGKPGYFDASVVTLTKSKPEKIKRSRVVRASTRRLADDFLLWLNKNPGSHPLYSAAGLALGKHSAGTVQNVAREIARRRLAKVNLTARPHTIASLGE